MKACIDSILFMLRASNINPKCDIVLYANSLFILYWFKPNTVPIIKDSKELNSKTIVQLNALEVLVV